MSDDFGGEPDTAQDAERRDTQCGGNAGMEKPQPIAHPQYHCAMHARQPVAETHVGVTFDP